MYCLEFRSSAAFQEAALAICTTLHLIRPSENLNISDLSIERFRSGRCNSTSPYIPMRSTVISCAHASGFAAVKSANCEQELNSGVEIEDQLDPNDFLA